MTAVHVSHGPADPALYQILTEIPACIADMNSPSRLVSKVAHRTIQRRAALEQMVAILPPQVPGRAGGSCHRGDRVAHARDEGELSKGLAAANQLGTQTWLTRIEQVHSPDSSTNRLSASSPA